MNRDDFIEQIQSLRLAPITNGKRHPHKPLLLLWLLAQAQRGEFGPFSYDEVEGPVDELLAEFGTPAKRDRGRAAMPFFHLEPALWDLIAMLPEHELGNNRAKLRAGRAAGKLRDDVVALLQNDGDLIVESASLLLAEHFTGSHVEPITSTIGIELDGASPGRFDVVVRRRHRDPAFREQTLRSYAYICAMCGWDGRASRQPVGVEAAHVRWHSQGGPDTADNGLALCSLHHKLFDLGLLGLTAERHILIAAEFVSDSETGHRMVHDLNGRPIRSPQPGSLPVADEHLEWHGREVFRGAA